ncbi:hypothetical protein VPH35_011402 [Triticum aestivum]
MIDLNELPVDVEPVNISVESGAPFLNTAYNQQDIHLEEGVGESPDPDIGSNNSHVSTTHVAAPNAVVGPANATVDDAPDLEDEEVGSQLQLPYVGMRFDTLVGAREHYNHYALAVGFSIKSNTSHKSAYTGVLDSSIGA